jgi:hypothetical protein
MIETHDTNPCPICHAAKRVYKFKIRGDQITTCDECGLMFSSSVELSRDDNEKPDIFENNLSIHRHSEDKTEFEANKKYLQMLSTNFPDVQNILLIAQRGHFFATMAKEYGFSVVAHLSLEDLEEGNDLLQAVDAVVCIYQLEKSKNISMVLEKIYAALRPGGLLYLVTLLLDSRPAQLFGSSWVGWQSENKIYFDSNTIQLMLWRFGFRKLWMNKDVREYTLAHINERASDFPKTWITRIIRTGFQIIPSNLHDHFFRLPSSGIIVSARKEEHRETPVLSIVLPVFDEESTFPVLMDQLLDLEIPEVKKEIIVVESNSRDTSRELVLKYINHEDVKIVLQKNARGKGNAVREGIEHATGDILLIQDADLEYDLNDYYALLEPILMYKKAFVLGARHGGKWKMRHFSDQQGLSTYFNFGHKLFTTLINLLYGQHMKDPFTMFKVVRRDCLHNLRFECDRFDFDFELVIKLIRKGYVPQEIPVNYVSRSFKEGKKVNMFRDPLTWIRASFKYRFVSIYLTEISKAE